MPDFICDPPLGFWTLRRFPAVSSHQHRVYLTQLCCACRFSQPLGAFLRSRPPRPYFMPNPSLGHHFQRFPPPSSQPPRSGLSPLVLLLSVSASILRVASGHHRQSGLQGFMHPGDPSPRVGFYPVLAARSSPSSSSLQGIRP